LLDAEQLKAKVIREIDTLAPKLLSASHTIHEYAEMAFKEYKSAALLEDLLEEHGLVVERGIAGMETAFRGMYRGKGQGPTIAILGEYDALPHGHACGHNIIGVAAVGAGIALKNSLGDVPGNISVLGCPAEEGGGGKVYIAKEGYLDGVDAALMTHPIAGTSMIGGPNLAITHFTIKYHGKAAHAASDPHEGINALDAMILGFQNVSALRQHVTEDVRMHGYIIDGGKAPNVIPDYTEAKYIVRAAKRVTLDKVAEKVRKCFAAGALATGATLEFDRGFSYSERIVNMTIARKVQANLRKLGVEVQDEPIPVRGSTDFGDVSQLVPAVNAYIQIAPDSVASHSNEMREAAKSPDGDKGLLNAAKAMAMTVVDLLTDPSILKGAWEEHERAMAQRR
jgi:amidohydrolase